MADTSWATNVRSPVALLVAWRMIAPVPASKQMVVVWPQGAGAGLDVYAKEPCTDSPLFTLENVVATPHLGASTGEAQEKAGVSVARSVRLALSGELVPDAVNVQGGVLAEAVKPVLPLAEKLGAIACRLSTKPIERVEVEVLGEIADEDVRVLELSALKGLFGQLVDDPVSYVNAPIMAKSRGIEVPR